MPTGRLGGRGVAFSRPTLRRIWTFARPYRRHIAVYSSAILAAALLALVPPLVVRQIIDTAIPDGDRTMITWLAVLGVARRGRPTPPSTSCSAGAAPVSARR